MEKYEFVKELDAGSFGVTKLMRNKQTKEVVVMKFIERDPKMTENIEREIMNHELLRHPNIHHLKEVMSCRTHVALVMEYVDEGQISERVYNNSGSFSKDEIVDGMEKYVFVKDLGAGSFGVTKLMRNKHTKELFAVKFIERGPTIDENVEREIINHRSLQHPNIVRFKEVILTRTHLGIVMEYAAGGELFEQIYNSGRLIEDEARYFFQQLICGLQYIHSMQICHRDLKLDNILLDGSNAPRVKICDFGYSKSSMLYSKPNTIIGSTTYSAPMDIAKGQYDGKLYPLHSTPNTTVGSPTYAAPEVLVEGQYDGKIADVWSCGVTLYIMLVGSYPFEDPSDPKNFHETITRIMGVRYKIPDNVKISQDCHHLLSRIFVRNPSRRISLKEIKSHPWFLKNLAWELKERIQSVYYRRDIPTFSHQSVDEIMKVVGKAKQQLPPSSTTIVGHESETEEEDETNVEENEEDESE